MKKVWNNIWKTRLTSHYKNRKRSKKNLIITSLIAPFLVAGYFNFKSYFHNFFNNYFNSRPDIPSEFNFYPGRLEKRIKKEGSEPNNKPDKIGIIVIGDDEKIFYPGASKTYQAFLANDFNQIYVLTESGNKTLYFPVDDVSSRDSLSMLIKHLSKKVDSKDLVVFSFYGHGNKEFFLNTNSTSLLTTFVLNSKSKFAGKNSFSSVELKNYFSLIHPGQGIFVIDSCHSGKYSDSIEGPYARCVSSKVFELSWTGKRFSFSGFLFEGLIPNGNIEEKDQNGDGRTSLGEAYRYALKKVKDRNKEMLRVQTPNCYAQKGKSLDEIFIDDKWDK